MTEHASLAAAFAAFQLELPTVHKGATGQVPGKRSYKYADLADLSAAVIPVLAKHGLSWLTMPTTNEQGQFVLRYELMHTSGESRVGEYELPAGNAWEIGSALTYGRRYCLSAVTGVAADEDDDGQASLSATTRAAQPRPQQSRQDPPKDPELYRERVLSRDITVEQLRQLHSTATAAGVLGAEVTDADGAQTTLGDLIVARGKALAPKAA